jgi:hypothetical protein
MTARQNATAAAEEKKEPQSAQKRAPMSKLGQSLASKLKGPAAKADEAASLK